MTMMMNGLFMFDITLYWIIWWNPPFICIIYLLEKGKKTQDL